MRVGIVDSGINEVVLTSRVEHIDIAGSKKITTDLDGHGTSTASVIEMNIEKSIEFFSVKIFDENLNATIKDFYYALDSLSQLDLDIINMSISISTDVLHLEIRKLCNRIIDNGTKLISSVSNSTGYTSMKEVERSITVEGKELDDYRHYYFDPHHCHAVADSSPLLVPYADDCYTFYQGNSKATALMTSHIINASNGNIVDINNLKKSTSSGRFGYDWFERFLKANGVDLIVVNNERLSPQEEIIQDLISIIHVFSCRVYGMRKYKKKIEEDEDIVKSIQD